MIGRCWEDDRTAGAFIASALGLFLVMVGLIIYLMLEISGAQSREHTNLVSACDEANVDRTEYVRIVDAILALPGVTHPQVSAEVGRVQAAALVRLRAQAAAAYAPRDCVAQYSRH